MGMVFPFRKGDAVPLPGKQTLEEMLEQQMPEGYCHVIVIGMDARKNIGMSHRCADLDTQIYMIKDILTYLKKMTRDK